jgi:starvation-inducible DNA-binding protein
MASIATSSHLPALGEPHEREAIGRELQATLQDLVNLALIAKQLHWAVIGPLFRPLHLQLDELVDSWRELADTIAERAVGWAGARHHCRLKAKTGRAGVHRGPRGRPGA